MPLGARSLSAVRNREASASMVISICNTDSVRCREVVRFSEGPLSEVRLYSAPHEQTEIITF